jgi:NADPH:quinone reductase-like Zn-dependent oxidoreductase
MKAAIVTRYGPPEVLQVADIADPVPADNEVRVRVHASTVCFGDRIVRAGPLLVRMLQGWRRPRVGILGVDLAGVVDAVGKNITRFAPGDEVFGSRGDRFGAHAELVCVAENKWLARKPHNMTLEEAATVFVGGVCSLYFLRRAQIRPGDRVLVHGASGSLGTFAVQLAKHFGGHVTAVCSARNAALVRSLGKAGVADGLRALTPGGRYLLVGIPDGVFNILAAMVAGAWASLRGSVRFIVGAAVPGERDLEFLKDLIEAGELRTVISRRYALADIAEAHRYADTGHKVGNVVVLIGSGASRQNLEHE